MSDAAKFDDELLSAYLDGELSAEERALVEEQLAADPQARRLLDELRGVSHAVRELPPAKLGMDLSGSIVRHAELAAKDEARTTAGGASERTWSMPIGRSKRSWFWAAAALAAGLLLMVYDRGTNERNDRPGRVAMSDEASGPTELGSPMSGLELRSRDATDTPLAAAGRSSAIATKSRDPGEARNDSTPLAASVPATTADGVVALGRRAEEAVAGDASRSLDFVAGSGAGGMGGAATAEVPAGAEDLVVVYVNTTPEAIEQRVFDAVLVRNDIEPEQAARAADAKGAANGDVDAVLVEATPWQIYGCMTELDNDKKNYLGIEVDPQTTSNQRAANFEPEKLSAYNRGLVPAEQKLATQRYFFSHANAAAGQQDKLGNQWSMVQKAEAPAPVQTEAPRLQQFGAMSDRRGQVQQTEPSIAASQPAGEMRSATRNQSTVENAPPAAPQITTGPTSESLPTNNYDAYYAANARRAVQKLAKKADTLQVLFVLTCPTDLSSATSDATISDATASGSATLAEPAAPASSSAREGIEE